MSLGLQGVPTSGLKTMLAQLHKGALPFPLTVSAVVAMGLQDHLTAIMHLMRDLPEAGVRAVLVAVLAERRDGAAS